jgi:hypothetical protein
MEFEKSIQAEDPVKAFQPCAQYDLQQQQTPRHHAEHLTRAQQVPVKAEFVKN